MPNTAGHGKLSKDMELTSWNFKIKSQKISCRCVCCSANETCFDLPEEG